MPFETFEQLLERAAALYGIEPGFWDIWGRYHPTTTTAKQAMLGAMGVPAETSQALESSLAAAARREWERLLPPAVVVREGDTALVINVSTDCLGRTARISIRREDGETSGFETQLGDLPRAGSIEMDGRTWVRKVAAVPLDPLGRLSGHCCAP